MAGICVRAGTFVYESYVPLFVVPFALGNILGPLLLGWAHCRPPTRGRRDARSGEMTGVTYTIFSDRTDKLLWGAGAIVVALLVLRVLSLTIARLEQRHADGERQLIRLRRGETAAALVGTAIPYIATIAVIILLASAFLPRSAAALGGSALVLILVGFGAQRFLTDVIAGALIAFERWYGIGDFVKIEPAQASGLVEQFGFRTTVLRSLNGDRTYIPNSQIVAATRSPRGYRRYSIELLTSDPREARRAIARVDRHAPVGEARFLRPPRVVEERELGEGTWLVRGQADVAPTMEWLAEGLLVSVLKAQLRGEALLAEPIVYTLDEGTLSRYERRVFVQ